jgi:hypothetical protein
LTEHPEWCINIIFTFLCLLSFLTSKLFMFMLMLQVGRRDEDDEDEVRYEAPDDEDTGRSRGGSDEVPSTSKGRGGSGEVPSTSTGSTYSSSLKNKKKAAGKSPLDVGEILTEMLMENRRRDRETEKKVNEKLYHDNLKFTFKCHVSCFPICDKLYCTVICHMSYVF